VTQNPGPYQQGQPNYQPPDQGRPPGPPPQGGPQQQPYGQGQQPPPYGQPQQPSYGQQPQGKELPAFAQKLTTFGENWGTGGAAAPTIARPKSVTLAFLLAAGGAVFGILYNIIWMISLPAFLGVNGGAIFSILIGVGLVALAVLMRNGAEWARITLAVLSGLGLLFALIALFSVGWLFTYLSGFGALVLIVLLAQAAALGATLYFLFRPESNAYFKSATSGPQHSG
jgi:hypothetical protein